MIARCKGINCTLRESCYRWLLPPVEDKNAYMQSMYSSMNQTCRFYWKVKPETDSTFIDRHVAILNAMIDRMNRNY